MCIRDSDRIAFIVNGKIEIIDSPRNLKLKYGTNKLKITYYSNSKLFEENFDLKGLGDNQKFIGLLKENKIETIHSQEANLEDVFIQVTGRNLR